MKASYLYAIACTSIIFGCTAPGNITDAEKELITSQQGRIMKIVTTDGQNVPEILTRKCLPLNETDMKSEEYEMLKQSMLLTVNDPENTGVGIAAPQVGIGCRLIAVKRHDKEQQPFEFYPNARIIYKSASEHSGIEGCLSVPNKAGRANRADTVTVVYTNESDLTTDTITVTDYTAVIFQHEIDHLDGSLYTSKMTEEIYVDTLARKHPEYLPEIELGSVAPNFTAKDTKGKNIRLSDYTGKYVIIDFWATWCGDCRNEMPEFKELHEEYKSKDINGIGVQFLSYSFDRDENQWKDYIADKELNWPQISTLQPNWHGIEVTQSYKLNWIPAFILVSPDGHVIGKTINVKSLKQLIKLIETPY